MTEFEIGRVYSRREDIHNVYGGQTQGGISTPSQHPVIFLFSGTGERHGYYDGYQPDGSFWFYGEGQVGDMVLTRGNRAVAQHVDNREAVFLFEYVETGRVRFIGRLQCNDWHYQEAPDSAGHTRQAIVFELGRVE